MKAFKQPFWGEEAAQGSHLPSLSGETDFRRPRRILFFGFGVKKFRRMGKRGEILAPWR